MANAPLLSTHHAPFGELSLADDEHELLRLYYDEMPLIGTLDDAEFERFKASEFEDAPDDASGSGAALSAGERSEPDTVSNPLVRHACVVGTVFCDLLVIAAIGWVLYYEVGNYAVFLYGVALTTAQFAYSYYLYRQARDRGDLRATWPNSLVAFVWWLCVVELALWLSLTSSAQRQWIVTWNGTVAGYATAVYWLAMGLVVETPSRTLEVLNPDYVIKFPHVEFTVRAFCILVGVSLTITNTVGIALVEKCGANPNAPMWSSLATFAFNWDSFILIVGGALAMNAVLVPGWKQRYPPRSFEEFLIERRRRQAAAAAADTPAPARSVDEANPLADAPAPAAAAAPPPPRSSALV